MTKAERALLLCIAHEFTDLTNLSSELHRLIAAVEAEDMQDVEAEAKVDRALKGVVQNGDHA